MGELPAMDGDVADSNISLTGSAYGRGRSKTPSTALNIVVVPPMPSPSERIAAAEVVGDFRSNRMANFRSERKNEEPL